MRAARQSVRVTIVGGGYSGAAAAVQLARGCGTRLAITIVEPRAEVGRGVAYSTDDPDHRLNGSLDNHLLDPAEPEALRRWCERHDVLARDPDALASNGRIYLRRGDFGAYLAETALAAVAGTGSALSHDRDVATGIRASASGFDVLTARGAVHPSDLVVIATGNGGPRLSAPLAPALAAHPAVIADPMDLTRIRSIPPTAGVLLVGSGLTALDVISTLLRRGHEQPIVSISRHGLRPRPQRPPSAETSVARLLARIEGEVPAFVSAAGTPPTARGLLHALRARIRQGEREGEDWYRAFDDLRDVVWQVWPGLAPEQKARFLRRLRPWYDAHRFRSPPQNEAIVADAERRGVVTFVTGRLRTAEALGDAIRVQWDDGCCPGGTRTERFDAVVNCTGLDPSCGARENPFLAEVLGQRLITVDACGMGFAVDAQCRPIAADGAANPRLRIVGPPTAGTFGDPLGVLFIAPQIRRMLPGVFADLGLAHAAGRTDRLSVA
jgi:uncharacterized NAD(P)/FAD-binding protein YdhS